MNESGTTKSALNHEERLFRKLLEEPFVFDQPTYEDLVERFRSRLTVEDILAIAARRVRNRKYTSLLERNTLLAIAEGRSDESERLLDLLERRNRAGITVLSSGPASPPRSS